MALHQIPRRDQRHLVPFASVKLVAQVLPGAGAEPLPCHVWDVSESGACLCFTEPPLSLAAGQQLVVQIFAPAGGQSLDLPSRLIWLDAIHGAHFVGIQWGSPLDLANTFLNDLLLPDQGVSA